MPFLLKGRPGKIAYSIGSIGLTGFLQLMTAATAPGQVHPRSVPDCAENESTEKGKTTIAIMPPTTEELSL